MDPRMAGSSIIDSFCFIRYLISLCRSASDWKEKNLLLVLFLGEGKWSSSSGKQQIQGQETGWLANRMFWKMWTFYGMDEENGEGTIKDVERLRRPRLVDGQEIGEIHRGASEAGRILSDSPVWTPPCACGRRYHSCYNTKLHDECEGVLQI